MALRRLWEEHCPECGKKQTGRVESNNRIWWRCCNCKQVPGPVDYPRLVNIPDIEHSRMPIKKDTKRLEDG